MRVPDASYLQSIIPQSPQYDLQDVQKVSYDAVVWPIVGDQNDVNANVRVDRRNMNDVAMSMRQGELS